MTGNRPGFNLRNSKEEPVDFHNLAAEMLKLQCGRYCAAAPIKLLKEVASRVAHMLHIHLCLLNPGRLGFPSPAA